MEKVLLHSCCAPCSAAILEWLLQNDYAPVIFFFNPNIYPENEYLKRKEEICRYAEKLGVPIVDEDAVMGQNKCDYKCFDSSARWEYIHGQWLQCADGLGDEPERGARCLNCFRYRLAATAVYAAENGFPLFTTTLASSRWKDLGQICQAGTEAESAVEGRSKFWDRNWRKGGLYERRNILARQFYNQQYCGCEFSMRRISKSQNNE